MMFLRAQSPVRQHLSWLKLELKRVWKVSRMRRGAKLAAFQFSEAKTHKTSDTLFVLGSGASINLLSEEDWKVISQNDSIGLNFWLMHDFVPTFYQFEAAGEIDRRAAFEALLAKRQASYHNTLFLYKDLERRQLSLEKTPAGILKNLRVVNKINLPLTSTTRMRQVLKFWRRLSVSRLTGLLLFGRASISQAISVGMEMRYKRIVLLGVDLNNVYYFWDTADRPVDFLSGQPGQVHKTIMPEFGDITIDDVIYDMNDILLRPQGIELFIGNKSSALYPKLPVFFE